jgi:hypothetical protein
LQIAAEIVLNRQLKQAFEVPEPNPQRLRALLAEITTGHIAVDEETLAFAANERLMSLAAELSHDAYDPASLHTFNRIASMARELPFEVNFWEAQNTLHHILKTEYPAQKQLADSANADAREWIRAIEDLADSLRIALPPTFDK